MGRAPCCEKMGLKKGPWTPEEDHILINYIRQNGHNNWRALPKQAGLLRCGKSCRLRWTNYLRPDIKRGNFTQEEEETIIKLHEMLGNRWSAIAAKLPGRTDNEIKNVWHTHLKKRLPLQTDTPDNGGFTSATTTVVSPATTMVNVGPGPTKKRSRKLNVSKRNEVPKKRASTHEKSKETSGIIMGSSDTNVKTMSTSSIKIEHVIPQQCTSSIKIEPVSPQPCTSEVSTVTSTSTSNNSENDTSRVENDNNQVENPGFNQDYLGDLPDINDDFWMEVLSVEDTAISTVEDWPCISESKDGILGVEPVFETEFPNNAEDMDVFWHNLLTESEELPEITEML
ncbi:hypothetical protein KSS87_012196 [Heliosperma pusillum]|nr:hypothetical protein KSS87_012196 [Heliosperma pusillum]